MRKLVYQQSQRLNVAVGSSVTVNTRLLLGPCEGAAGVPGSGLSAVAARAANATVVFNVQPFGGQAQLGLWAATITKTTVGVDGDNGIFSQTFICDALLPLLRGVLKVASEGTALQSVALTLTNYGAESSGLFVRVEIHGDFQPHAGPADRQDAQGYGLKVDWFNGIAQTQETGTLTYQPMMTTEDFTSNDDMDGIS